MESSSHWKRQKLKKKQRRKNLLRNWPSPNTETLSQNPKANFVRCLIVKPKTKNSTACPKRPKTKAEFLISQWITNVVQDGIEVKECQFHLSKILEYTDFKN